jgi:proline dehydrogenase
MTSPLAVHIKTLHALYHSHQCLTCPFFVCVQIMKLTRAVFGDRLFKLFMKSTFYGHFVAGEDSQEIRPVLERLLTFGVKPILDYSVEEDLSQEEAEQREVA